MATAKYRINERPLLSEPYVLGLVRASMEPAPRISDRDPVTRLGTGYAEIIPEKIDGPFPF